MTSTRVVMFVSPDPGHRELYVEELRRLNVLSIWVDSVKDAAKLLAQFRVAAIVIYMAAGDHVRPCAEFVVTAWPSPVIVLGSVGWSSSAEIERAFETGCTGVVAEPCTAATLAAIVSRSIAGERRIRWPDSRSVDAG